VMNTLSGLSCSNFRKRNIEAPFPSQIQLFSGAHNKMSGFTGMPPPKMQDMFQVVIIDDAIAESESSVISPYTVDGGLM